LHSKTDRLLVETKSISNASLSGISTRSWRETSLSIAARRERVIEADSYR
jgi:hypothetical protein